MKQRGTKYHAGDNVYVSKDHSLHARVYGQVRFGMGKIRRDKQYVSIVPLDIEPAIIADLRKTKQATRRI